MKTISLLILFLLTGCRNLESTHPIVREYTGTDYTVFQTDSVRTYLSPTFSNALMGWGDKIKPYQDDYNRQLVDLGPLFRNGQLTGEMFWSVLWDSTHSVEPFARPESFSTQRSAFGETYSAEVDGYNGPLLKILLVNRTDTLDMLRYHIRATTDKHEDGWGGMLEYTLDVRDGQVLSLHYAGMGL